MKFTKLLKKNIFGLLYLSMAFIVFFLIFKLKIDTDLQAHILILKKYLDHGYFPVPPLYYFTIYTVSLLFYIKYFAAAILVLTIFSLLKYYLVLNYITEEVPANKSLLAGISALSLMIIAPIALPLLDNTLYIAKFTSTIWHNSTTIFVFPFCIWLYIESLKFLKKPDGLLFTKLIFISIIIIIAKPSFLFAFLVVFPIICLYQFGWRKWFFYSVLLSVIIIICLAIEKSIIYQNNPLDQLVYKGEISKIIIAPFKVWLSRTKHPFVNLLVSFLFFISFAILKFRSIKKDREFIYSFSLLLTSILIYFIFAESGPRFSHGNFYWQIPISILIMDMVMLKRIIIPYVKIEPNEQSLKIISQPDKWLLFIYLFHFISGIYYILRILIEKNYY